MLQVVAAGSDLIGATRGDHRYSHLSSGFRPCWRRVARSPSRLTAVAHRERRMHWAVGVVTSTRETGGLLEIAGEIEDSWTIQIRGVTVHATNGPAALARPDATRPMAAHRRRWRIRHRVAALQQASSTKTPSRTSLPLKDLQERSNAGTRPSSSSARVAGGPEIGTADNRRRTGPIHPRDAGRSIGPSSSTVTSTPHPYLQVGESIFSESTCT